MTTRPWFRFQAKAPETTELLLYDAIGGWDPFEGTTARAFVEELAKVPDTVKTIVCRINSPGGDVFAGLTIANALRDQRDRGRRVETVVDGLAASAASLVVMAGGPARMMSGALLMVHNPWSWSIGSAEDMRKAAESLDKIRGSCVATYRWKTSLSEEEIGALMDAETWMDADEARARGFVDEVLPGAAAAFDSRALGALKVPERFAARFKAQARQEPARPSAPAAPAPRVASASEIVGLCKRAGLDLAFAQALVTQGLSRADVKARIAHEQAVRFEARQLEKDIRALCARFGQDDLAAGYVAGGMTVAAVKDHLSKILPKLDPVEIDSGLRPDHGTKRGPTIDVAKVYARRNREGD